MKVDYRELLLKYIAHVGECEGVTFILGGRLENSIVDFSDGEMEELVRIDKESIELLERLQNLRRSMTD